VARVHAGETSVGETPLISSPVPQLEEVVGEFRSHPRTVGESVLDILRESILRGVFEPGQRLRQEELAQRIGVSRIPVRTALMQLESEGLVVFEAYRGATVRSLSAERLREIYALRILLETYVLRAAIESLSDEEKAYAVEEGIRLDKMVEGPDFLNDRIAFYRTLYDAQHNPVALELIEQLRVSIGRHRLGLRLQHTGFDHESLARAVQRGDAKTAESLLRTHLSSVCEGMVAHITHG
jgi:DNA-binding GntR family transcriptional regulator